MQILPVLDLLDGVVVRGVAGRRDEYRPVESVIADAPDAITIAGAFRERFGLDEFYLADLDAILHCRPHLDLYRQLSVNGFRLLIDAGVRDVGDAEPLLAAGAHDVVAGLETLSGPGALKRLCDRHDSERIAFSLDLQSGAPLGDPAAWETDEPFEIARMAIAAGVRRMIVLDLAGVGVGRGVPTLDLCRRIREAFPDTELITGGGVRAAADLRQLADAGLDGALVASALHDGSIVADELTALRAS